MLPPSACRPCCASTMEAHCCSKGLCASSLCPQIPHAPAPTFGGFRLRKASVLPALLQKFVCDFLKFLGGKFGGKFAGFSDPRKKGSKTRGKFRSIFREKSRASNKNIYCANFVLQTCHSSICGGRFGSDSGSLPGWFQPVTLTLGPWQLQLWVLGQKAKSYTIIAPQDRPFHVMDPTLLRSINAARRSFKDPERARRDGTVALCLLYVYSLVLTYIVHIYMCCEVTNWATFGHFNSY